MKIQIGYKSHTNLHTIIGLMKYNPMNSDVIKKQYIRILHV